MGKGGEQGSSDLGGCRDGCRGLQQHPIPTPALKTPTWVYLVLHQPTSNILYSAQKNVNGMIAYMVHYAGVLTSRMNMDGIIL